MKTALLYSHLTPLTPTLTLIKDTETREMWLLTMLVGIVRTVFGHLPTTPWSGVCINKSNTHSCFNIGWLYWAIKSWVFKSYSALKSGHVEVVLATLFPIYFLASFHRVFDNFAPKMRGIALQFVFWGHFCMKSTIFERIVNFTPYGTFLLTVAVPIRH